MSNERVNIFIDGGNFYHLALRKLGSSESNFDFEKFAVFLANGRKISDMGKRFYIGTVPERPGDQRSKEAMSKQTALFTRLRDAKWEIRTSKLRKRVEEIKIDDRVLDYKNILKKGTDLIVGAVDDKIEGKINTDILFTMKIWDVVIEIFKKKEIDALVLEISKEIK